MTPKEKVKDLMNEFYEVDIMNIDITDYHLKQYALLCISKQFELLRYLGSKTSEELYNDLVEQKKALKDTFN